MRFLLYSSTCDNLICMFVCVCFFVCDPRMFVVVDVTVTNSVVLLCFLH